MTLPRNENSPARGRSARAMRSPPGRLAARAMKHRVETHERAKASVVGGTVPTSSLASTNCVPHTALLKSKPR